jgi:hypothetical protein
VGTSLSAGRIIDGPAKQAGFPDDFYRDGMSGFSLSSEPFTLERDCNAVMVPQGENVVLPAGQVGYITQALGGSFTVYVEGNLFRIAGNDADALGKETPPPLELPTPPMPTWKTSYGSNCEPCSILRFPSTWSNWAWSTT